MPPNPRKTLQAPLSRVVVSSGVELRYPYPAKTIKGSTLDWRASQIRITPGHRCTHPPMTIPKSIAKSPVKATKAPLRFRNAEVSLAASVAPAVHTGYYRRRKSIAYPFERGKRLTSPPAPTPKIPLEMMSIQIMPSIVVPLAAVLKITPSSIKSVAHITPALRPIRSIKLPKKRAPIRPRYGQWYCSERKCSSEHSPMMMPTK